jgi:pilus assembly protein TadC
MKFEAYEAIGRLFPRTRIRELGSALDSAGMNMVPEAFAGFFLVMGALLSVLFSLSILSIPDLQRLLISFSLAAFQSLTITSPLFVTLLGIVVGTLLAFALLSLLVYVFVILVTDARKRSVENALPNFLTLAASNVRAGMTLDQAMWYAAKPEFGLLSKEVETVAKQTFGGVPFNQAIDRFAERFSSKSIKRVVALLKQGIASGGEMAQILEHTADDTRNMQMISKEIAASLMMYVIFVSFAAALGTPFLFGVSSKLIEVLKEVPLPPAGAVPDLGFARPAPVSISLSAFQLFTLGSSVVTAIFSSFIIGVIQSGSKKGGIKFIPFMIGISLLVYFLVSLMLKQFFLTI